MSKPKKNSRDYPVGFGKPPEHSRYCKGQSGNPKGRPKGKKNRHTIIDEVLFEPIRIQQNGKAKTVPALEAIVLKLRNDALGGNLRAAIMAIQLAGRTGGDEDSQANSAAAPLDDEALLRIMKDFIDHNAPPTLDGNQANEETNDNGGGDDQ